MSEKVIVRPANFVHVAIQCRFTSVLLPFFPGPGRSDTPQFFFCVFHQLSLCVTNDLPFGVTLDLPVCATLARHSLLVQQEWVCDAQTSCDILLFRCRSGAHAQTEHVDNPGRNVAS